MDGEQALVELNRFAFGRIGIGAVGFPSHEVRDWPQCWARCFDFESVFGFGARMFTRGIEVDGRERDEVKQGGSVGVG